MKKLLLTLSLPLSLFSNEEPSKSLWDYSPIHTGGNAIYIANAEVSPRKDHSDGHLQFDKENAFLYMLLPVSETTYFFPRVEFNTINVSWDKNPKIHQSRYYYAQFGLMLYTKALEKWRWILRYDLNIDTQHFSKPGLYGLSTWFLWGSYQIHRKWNYHIGTTGYAGLQGFTFYPIIGADFSPNKTWTFVAIFPFNYAVEYHLLPYCQLSLKARPLRERFRTGKNEPQPRSVFNYSSIGTEFNVLLKKEMKVECELFAGYNFGGTYYIKAYKKGSPYYTDVGGAPYAGINLDYAF